MYGFNDLTVGWRPWGWLPADEGLDTSRMTFSKRSLFGIQISDVFWVFGHLHHQGFHRCPQGPPHHRLYHEESSIWSYRRKDYSWWSLEHFSCWLPWKNLVWSLDYGLKNSGELIFCCLLFNTYQSSSTTTSPLEVIFFVPNRISWRGLTRVIPLAEMARVRICNYKRHTLYCICIPRKVDKKLTLSR